MTTKKKLKQESETYRLLFWTISDAIYKCSYYLFVFG